jgi:hypothetical protein
VKLIVKGVCGGLPGGTCIDAARLANEGRANVTLVDGLAQHCKVYGLLKRMDDAYI